MSDRIGSAEWINPEAVAEDFAFEPGAFWLGRTIDRDAKMIGLKDDRHILIVAGTRGGKGTTVLVNNLCLWPGSAVVIDPKGENATITAARRAGGETTDAYRVEGMGQAVHVLDPYHVAHVPDELRATFNPIEWLKADDPLLTKKAERLATALVPYAEKAEDYWDNEARSLLSALFVHVATDVMYEGQRHLMTVRDLVMRGDIVTYEIAEREGEYIDEPLDLLWRNMTNNLVADGYVRDQGVYYRDQAKASSKQWAGIRGAVKTATDFINGKGMRDCLESSTFDFDDLKKSEQGSTVYLSIPQDFLETDRGWMRMMIEIVAMQAKLIKGQPRCGHPTLLLLDEFAGLERMDVLENSIAQLAGYGVKMVCVVQSIAQLKQTYKESWEIFVSGSSRIFFEVEDNLTRDYVSKQAGETEIIREGESFNQSEAENESETKGITKTKGRSTNRGTSKNNGWNRGSGLNFGLNFGGNSGTNYDPQGLMSLFPAKKTGTNSGRGGGLSGGYNRNSGRSGGGGSSSGSGTNYSEATNQSKTTGRTVTEAHGRSESFHKRALIEPQEVGFKFARVTDYDDPRYPGVMLVMISGERPMPIRKSNYFEDPLFDGLYSPHPDHDYRPLTSIERELPYARCHSSDPPQQLIEVILPSAGQTFMAFGQLDRIPCRLDKEQGDLVAIDDRLIGWDLPETIEYPKEAGLPPAIHSPIRGAVYRAWEPLDETEGYQPGEFVYWIEPDGPLPEKYVEKAEAMIEDAASNWDGYTVKLKGEFRRQIFWPWVGRGMAIFAPLLLMLCTMDNWFTDVGPPVWSVPAAIATWTIWRYGREFLELSAIVRSFFPATFCKNARFLTHLVDNDQDVPSAVTQARINAIEKEKETYRFDHDLQEFVRID